MMPVYGSPRAVRDAQVNRWLRRGAPGLMRGRSERVAPVVFDKQRGTIPSAGVGPDGGDGLPGAIGMSVGMKAFFVIGSGIGGSNQTDKLGCLWSGDQGRVAPVNPPTTDIEAIPRLEKISNTPANSSVSANEILSNGTGTALIYQVGLGNGRGGFDSMFEFGLRTLTGTQRWFIGFTTQSSPSGDPSAFTNMVGVGQDSADGSPQFMTNDGSGTATKVSTGFASIVADRIYQVRVRCSPFTTDAVIEFESFVGAVSTGVASHTFTTNLPVAGMTPTFYANNGSAGGSVRLVVVAWWRNLQPRAGDL